MALSQLELARLYACALLLGVGSGVLYDCFRISRVFLGAHYSRRLSEKWMMRELPLLGKPNRHRESPLLGIVVFLEDFLFCLISGVAVILLLYEGNSGVFRFPVLLCMALGFVFYRGTLGRAIMLFSEAIAFLIGTGTRYVLFFVTFPFRFFGRMLARGAKKLIGAFKARMERGQRRRYTAILSAQLERNAGGLIFSAGHKKEFRKGGKRYAEKAKKAIQSDAGHENLSRGRGRFRSGGIRRKRDEVQCHSRGAKGA